MKKIMSSPKAICIMFMFFFCLIYGTFTKLGSQRVSLPDRGLSTGCELLDACNCTRQVLPTVSNVTPNVTSLQGTYTTSDIFVSVSPNSAASAASTTTRDGTQTEVNGEFVFMNISKLNETGGIPKPIPEHWYYRRQPRKVNSWTFPVIEENDALCVPNYGEQIKAVAMVISGSENRKTRQDLRETWGGQMKQTPGFRMTFVTGSSQNESTMQSLLDEAMLYGDLLIFDFIDHYNNLTIKTMMAFTWAKIHCSGSRFVLKIDDDMIINMQGLIGNINYHLKNVSHRIIGNNIGRRPVLRYSRWAVPEEQYPYYRFPDYVNGVMYCIRSDVIPALLATSEYVPLVRIEDFYLTGLVRTIAGICDVTSDLNYASLYLPHVKNGYEKLANGTLMAVHHFALQKRLELHKRMLNHQFNQSEIN